MSGHSKWSQIKHKKAITDAKKGKLFSKVVREITVAARTFGHMPETNVRLKAAIERARSYGLPKGNIERAINKASGAGEEPDLQEFLYEAAFPGGVALLIEGITDNKNRTFAETRRILTDYDSRLAEPGSMLWNFEKIGVATLARIPSTASLPEDVELCLIEAGARDIIAQDDVWRVETAFTNIETMRKAAAEICRLQIQESGHDYQPKSSIRLGAVAREKLDGLLDALLEHDDVQEVYTNVGE